SAHVSLSCLLRASSSTSFSTATATTQIYTLSLHDALPISQPPQQTCQLPCASSATSCHNCGPRFAAWNPPWSSSAKSGVAASKRSEEHTSELQSRENLVCRLLLEKKKKK